MGGYPLIQLTPAASSVNLPAPAYLRKLLISSTLMAHSSAGCLSQSLIQALLA